MFKLIVMGTALCALTLALLAVLPLELRLIGAVPVFAIWCAGARCIERWIGGGR